FDNPYIDPDAAERIVGQERFQAAGALAQRRAIVLLKNGAAADGAVLPVRGRPKVYVENINPQVAGAYAEVVGSLEDADLAIMRLAAPYEPRDGNFLERMFHAGDLDFKGEELARILAVLE